MRRSAGKSSKREARAGCVQGELAREKMRATTRAACQRGRPWAMRGGRAVQPERATSIEEAKAQDQISSDLLRAFRLGRHWLLSACPPAQPLPQPQPGLPRHQPLFKRSPSGRSFYLSGLYRPPFLLLSDLFSTNPRPTAPHHVSTTTQKPHTRDGGLLIRHERVNDALLEPACRDTGPSDDGRRTLVPATRPLRTSDTPATPL